jgi:hypothetical protein
LVEILFNRRDAKARRRIKNILALVFSAPPRLCG